MTISRRNLLLGGAAAAALAGCAQPSKFRNYQGPTVTSILVYKGARRMYPMHGSAALRAYDVEIGGNPVGHKIMEGDGKTPEGTCFIARHNPNSRYHPSLGISDAEDVARAAALGVRPGGDIMIHGTPRAERRRDDGTAGCIAVGDREMEWTYATVRDGTPITIFP